VILRVCTDVQCVASVACGGFQFIVMMDGCDGTYTVAGVEHIVHCRYAPVGPSAVVSDAC
jgi:hypothetical protein